MHHIGCLMTTVMWGIHLINIFNPTENIFIVWTMGMHTREKWY